MKEAITSCQQGDERRYSEHFGMIQYRGGGEERVIELLI